MTLSFASSIDGDHVPNLQRAMRKLRAEVDARFPNMPFKPSLARLDHVIAYVKHHPVAIDLPTPAFDEKSYAELARLALEHDCAPRLILTAIMLCAAHESAS